MATSLIVNSNYSGNINITGWEGVTYNSFGDSITLGKTWQLKINNELNTLYKNYGISGARISGDSDIAYWKDTRIDILNKNSKYIIIQGGANDFAGSVILGDIDSINTSEFYGALNVIAGKLLNYWNHDKIIFITTLYHEFYLFTPDAHINQSGLQTLDYANAIINIANKYNFHYVDAYTNMGVNATNIETYLPGGIHPNDAGGQLLADVVIEKLITINPTQ